jgi:aspartyl-tRNA(Asn)/glutamyl-tRNA(Gln) amidotransferase subunit B
MNSVRNVQRAVLHERDRQIAELEAGRVIHSETRTFDDQSGTTSGMRTKEELNDYRYFPEPDLSPLIISDEWLNSIKGKMPELPDELYNRFTSEFGLPEYDAEILTENREDAAYFIEACKFTKNYKSVSNWIMGPVKSWLNEQKSDMTRFPVSPSGLAELIALIDSGKLSHTTAGKSVFPEMIKNANISPLTIAEENNLIQDSDSQNIMPIIEEVLESMPEKVKAYKKGKKGLIGLFMGELMKKSKGKADPKLANELLRKKLEKLN